MKQIPKSIFDMIIAYHTDDPYTGDSCVYSRYGIKVLREVRDLILKENPFQWTLISDTEDKIHFSDKNNENCILTTDKNIINNLPEWWGLKISI